MLVHVPDLYEGELDIREGTTSVYDGAAKNCRNIESVVISDSVTEIGDEAFYNCTALKSVLFGNAPIKRIGSRAFYSCNALPSVCLPNETEEIGAEAFAKCDALAFISLDTNGEPQLKTIGERAFYECSSLRGIDTEDVLCLDAFTEVTSVGKEAFASCNVIESVRLPQSLKEIPEGMFDNSDMVKNVEWGGAEIVSKNAFRATAIEVADMSSSNVKCIEDGAFANCEKLYAAAFGSAQTEISQLFADSGKRIIVYLPSGVPSLDSADAANLEESGAIYDIVYTTASNDDMAQQIFGAGHTSPHSGSYKIYDGSLYNLVSSEATLVKVGLAKTKLTMPTSYKITACEENAFNGCDSLESVLWNKTVKNIPSYAFAGNTNLKIFLFRDISNETAASGATIGEYAFEGCTSLETMRMSKNIASVGSGAFMGCTSLKEVLWQMPADIPDDAFNGCTSLEKFSVSSNTIDGLQSIGERAFKDCRMLTDMGGLNNLQFAELISIKDNAFENCDSIVSLILPSCMQSIGNEVFAGCSALESVYINGSIEELGRMVFGDDVGTSRFVLDGAEDFREKWGAQLDEDYGEDASIKLITDKSEQVLQSTETAEQLDETVKTDEIDMMLETNDADSMEKTENNEEETPPKTDSSVSDNINEENTDDKDIESGEEIKEEIEAEEKEEKEETQTQEKDEEAEEKSQESEETEKVEEIQEIEETPES
jgi:hypothetical protein